MILHKLMHLFIFISIEIGLSQCLTNSCQKNRYIDYNQLIEADCFIETCIFPANCTDASLCACKRDFVVRYNVTVEHDEQEHDDHHDDEDEYGTNFHFAVITQAPVSGNTKILVGRSYPCFYDERDITTVFWYKPNRKTYFIILAFCLLFIASIILVPLICFFFIIEFSK